MKKTLYTITSLLLCVLFICFMLFVMIEGLHILDCANGLRAMIFTGIDILLLLTVVGFGKPISKIVGVSMYVPICVATAIYMILAFGSTLILSFFLPPIVFTILKLFMLLNLLCITIPLAVVGMSENNKKNNN